MRTFDHLICMRKLKIGYVFVCFFVGFNKSFAVKASTYSCPSTDNTGYFLTLIYQGRFDQRGVRLDRHAEAPK